MARTAQVAARGTFTRLAGAVALLAGVFAASHAGYGFAQARPQAPAAKKAEPPSKYDQYEPSRTRRMRAEICGRDEESIGAYCVKVCQKGYLLVPDSEPPRCRSVEPLPPGQLPGPIRKETGVQPKLPPPPPGTPRQAPAGV